MIREQIEIAAPVARVWQYLAEPARMSAWMPGIRHLQSRDGTALRRGSKLIMTTGRAVRIADVTVLEAERALTLVGRDDHFILTYRYGLSALPGGAMASLHATCEAHGWAVVVAPLLRARIRKADRWQLAYLKGVVEKDAEHDPA